MEILENRSLTREYVVVDNKLFVNCRFEECLLIYAGGDYHARGCEFTHCSFRLEGPALRTLEFLFEMGLVPRDAIPKGVFDPSPPTVQ
jgi:hypothetical protein